MLETPDCFRGVWYAFSKLFLASMSWRRSGEVDPAASPWRLRISISVLWAIHLSGPDEKRPLDAVVMAAWRTKILRLVRLTEYPLAFLSFFPSSIRFPWSIRGWRE